MNQYTQRAVAGNVDVTGLAPSASTVTVNGSSTGVARQGDWYFKAYGVTNTSNAVWSSLAVASSLGGSETRNAFVALTPEAFTYDDDGNLTSDGRWDYTYDAENRLVSMQTHTALSPGILPNADARRIEFKNDYLGRRVQKTVRAGWNGSTFTTVVSDLKFLYDGWNLLFELDAANSLAKVRAYIWGLDWSGTLQGAGGVGGLLHERDIATSTSLRPAYDGNGNLMGLLNATDGTFAAAYEYDAFGQTLRATGTHAAGNPFRFSTKYTDTETGLVYYGLRYYSPSHGRFISRDPKDEMGGLNLYAFIRNNAVNGWDYLGMTGFLNCGWSGVQMMQEMAQAHQMAVAQRAADEAASKERTTQNRAGQLISPINSGLLMAHSQAVGFAPASPNNNPTAPSVASEAWNAAVSGGIDFLRTPFDALAYVGGQIDRATDAAAYALGRNNIVDPTMAKGALNALTVFAPQLIAGTASLVAQTTNQISTALRIGQSFTEIAAIAAESRSGQLALTAGRGYNPWTGAITSDVAAADTRMFRVWGDGADKVGGWLTPTPPASQLSAIRDLALPVENSAQWISEVTVPAGTRFQIGTAAEAFGQPGGGAQILLLDRIPPSNFGTGTSLGLR